MRDALDINGNNSLIVVPTRHFERVNSLECSDSN